MEDPNLEYLCLDEIPDNSFVLLKVDVAGPMEKNQAADGLVGILDQYQDIFIKKKLTLMILTPKESLEVLTEAEMNQAGWFKKDSCSPR